MVNVLTTTMRMQSSDEVSPSAVGETYTSNTTTGSDEQTPATPTTVEDYEETADSFPIVVDEDPADLSGNDGATEGDSNAMVVDRESLDLIARSYPGGPPSVATTELASAVGSVVGEPKKPYLKSITFYKDQPEGIEWDIQLSDPNMEGLQGRRGFRRFTSRPKLYINAVGGILAFSKLKEGDALKFINGKHIGASYNAAIAMDRLQSAYDEDGLLSIATGSKDEGVDDILIEATIIKPRPNMTYEELGMTVWHWGYLCVRNIDKDSIFKHTVLKSNDHIIAINDIECDRVSPEQFAHIITELPLDVTLTVLRRRQRITGKFG